MNWSFLPACAHWSHCTSSHCSVLLQACACCCCCYCCYCCCLMCSRWPHSCALVSRASRTSRRTRLAMNGCGDAKQPRKRCPSRPASKNTKRPQFTPEGSNGCRSSGCQSRRRLIRQECLLAMPALYLERRHLLGQLWLPGDRAQQQARSRNGCATGCIFVLLVCACRACCCLILFRPRLSQVARARF